MYYTRSYNLKTGEIKTEGIFSNVEDSEDLCKELCREADKDENARSVYITEETEEPQRTIEEATANVVAQICQDTGIPDTHFEEILSLFKQNL